MREIMIKGYFKQILIGIDQLLNTLFRGWADETLSCRAYRWEKNNIRSFPRKIIDKIFFWEKDHCYLSYLSEVERRQLPPELRNNE